MALKTVARGVVGTNADPLGESGSDSALCAAFSENLKAGLKASGLLVAGNAKLNPGAELDGDLAPP